MTLVYRDKDGKIVFHEVASELEHVIRIQFDRDDTTFDCPPSGEVYLCLWAGEVPYDERSRIGPAASVYNTRTVHVAWFWDTDEDPTQIPCSTRDDTTRSDRCDPALTIPGDDDTGDDDYDDGDATGGDDDDDDDGPEVTVPSDDDPDGGYVESGGTGRAGRGGGLKVRSGAAIGDRPAIRIEHLRRMRASVEAAVRGAIRIATGIAPSGGTGIVFKGRVE